MIVPINVDLHDDTHLHVHVNYNKAHPGEKDTIVVQLDFVPSSDQRKQTASVPPIRKCAMNKCNPHLSHCIRQKFEPHSEFEATDCEWVRTYNCYPGSE